MSSLRSHFAAVIESSARRISLPALAAWAVGVGGFFALAASPFASWFRVPALGEDGSLTTHSPAVEWLFRALCFVVVAGSAMSFWRSREWRRVCGNLFLALFVALLFFPYCVAIWSPEVAGEARWLHGQHESLTSGTGDLYSAQESKDVFWRQRVSLSNRAIESQIHRLPDWGPANFGWGRMAETVEWFGLASWFAFFLGKGWVLATVGAAAVLFALCREQAGAVLARRGLVLFASLLVIALLPPGVANHFFRQARQAAQRGDSAAALHSLRVGSAWMPSVREDGTFTLELGLLEDALGSATPAAEHYRARLLEEQGFAAQAREVYLAGLTSPEATPALARECAKALLRQGAAALNTGDVNGAIELFETVADADPCNLSASYALQLAYLRRGDREGLRREMEGMTATYRLLNTPTKDAILANGNENLAFNEYQRGDLAAAREAWGRAKRH